MNQATTSPLCSPRAAQAETPPEAEPQLPTEKVEFGRDIPNYSGPKDGRSAPKHRGFINGACKVILAGRYRLEVENEEVLHRPGPQVFAPTHPSAFDPAVVQRILAHRDVRFMSNQQIFRGIPGTLFTWAGAFPVDREGAAEATKAHCAEVLAQGNSLCVFPEGTLIGLHDQVGPMKKGAAASAIQGGAESVIPIAMEYVPNEKPRVKEAAIGLLTAGAVTAAGVFGAMHLPGLQTTIATVGGVLTGAYAGGKLAYSLVKEGAPKLQSAPRYLAGLGGALLGSLVFGTAAGLTSSFAPSVAPGLATTMAVSGGVGTWGMATFLRNRDIARIIVCDPIPVSKYAADPEGSLHLTEDLHRSLGAAKEKLTGVKYDETAPKIGGKVVETLKGGLVGAAKPAAEAASKKEPDDDDPGCMGYKHIPELPKGPSMGHGFKLPRG